MFDTTKELLNAVDANGTGSRAIFLELFLDAFVVEMHKAHESNPAVASAFHAASTQALLDVKNAIKPE